ncbi:putative Protein kinase domain containing protein [Blattamonas nauphoetae]|uniref:non-specific serine/threonine protein kinase n=1 Tax=Blattamonas nauphoetae TaxID=2049346 RepID=A0ABQ9XSU5_9EUKA|nr:putative Protein kinase domain containing protein [Blattamonas nauphoetae]
MQDISSALDANHNHPDDRMAHGDIKMENILISPDGHAKLCDLGAAESEDVSNTRSVMSQLYVSPERMDSTTGKATCEADVWALGIVLHWLLFGEPPFVGKSLLKLGQEIGSFRVSMIGESCGGEERALLMRMLDPDPQTRVTSRQLSSGHAFRCLVNSTDALWKMKDSDDKEWEAIRRERDELRRLLQLEREKNAMLERDLTALRKRPTEPQVELEEPIDGTVRAGSSRFVFLPPLLFTETSHFEQAGNVITRSSVGVNKHNHSDWSSMLSAEVFSSGVVSVSLTLLSIAPPSHAEIQTRSTPIEEKVVYFGFVESTAEIPQLAERIGWNVSNSLSLSSKQARIWFRLPSALKNSGMQSHASLKEGDRVTMEVDLSSSPRTVQFIVYGKSGSCFVSGIPPSIRLGVSVQGKGTSFRVDEITRHAARTPFIPEMAEVKWN